MAKMKTVLTLAAVICLLTGVIFYYTGNTAKGASCIMLALFSIIVIIGLQLSAYYHNHFVKRRRN